MINSIKPKTNLFKSSARGVDSQRLAKSNDTLLGTSTTTLDHDKVLVDKTVVRETTHRVNGLLGQVILGSTRLGVSTIGNTVDLLVDLSTAMVTTLTSTGNRVHDSGRMPGTDTSDLTETTMGLARKLLGTPTSGDTLETVTLGGGNDVNVFVLFKDGTDSDFLLKVFTSKVNLLFNGTTVQLDFHKVSLALVDLGLGDLGVSNDTDNGTVLLDTLEFTSDILGTISILGSILSEGLLLGTVPVLVESALGFLGEVLGPDGGQGTETTRSLDVTDNTDNNHSGSFDDSDGFDNFLLVHLCNKNWISLEFILPSKFPFYSLTGTRTLKITDNVGHTSLITQEGSQVDRLLGIILRISLDAATVRSSSLAGTETQMTMARS
jgi:hypothetical protein